MDDVSYDLPTVRLREREALHAPAPRFMVGPQCTDDGPLVPGPPPKYGSTTSRSIDVRQSVQLRRLAAFSKVSI